MTEKHKNTVLVLDSATLGRGADELGANLMVNFLRNLAFRDDLPETILCYNTGARLTETTSPAFPMLQALADKGVEIILCGTCVEYFRLQNKVGIGRVGDMRGIVEALMKADKVIYA